MTAQLPSHLYVHMPFCRSKCSYCDFVSVANADEELVDAVTEAICGDLRRWASSALPGVVETLYVGGGTPTYVADGTLRILEQAASCLPLRDGAEVTAEANPESLTTALAAQLKSVGVTRLSLGVQSFDDGMLRLLGRPHDARTATAAAEAAVNAGLSLSVDLICGVPGQTMTSWQETLDRAIRTDARHVSVYPLSVEEGTPLAAACDTGLVREPDPDVAADMMILAEDLLRAAGFSRYETANYARAGFESRHNIAYWTGRQYLGIGPAAHSMLTAATAAAVDLWSLPASSPGDDATCDVSRIRCAEPADIGAWLSGASETIEVLTAEEAQREDVMLGMRLAAGVSADRVHDAGLDEVFAGLVRDGLVESRTRTGLRAPAGAEIATWTTTRRGWLLGNEVFGRIWSSD